MANRRDSCEPGYCVQLDAIMRTVSTFSLGPLIELELLELAVEPAAPLVAELGDEDGDEDEDELSSVPVISTLCPTCALSFESSASRR